MRPIHRWSLVALAVALVVLVPMAVRARPVADEPMSARDLLARVQGSEGAAYAGTVEVHGRLGLPVSDHFTDVADLLGSDTRMRVWWRDADAWRVDKLLPTGEIDLFHHGHVTTRWDYERAEAQTGVDPEMRLPRDADLLPPALARRALTGAVAERRQPSARTPHRRARRARPPPPAERPADERRPRRPLGRPRHRPGAGARRLRRRAAAGAQHGVHQRRPQPAAGSRHVVPCRAAACAGPSTTCSTSPTRPTSSLPCSRPTPSRGSPAPPPRSRLSVSTAAASPRCWRCRCRSARPAPSPSSSRTSGARTVDGQLVLRVGPLGVALTFSRQPVDVAWVVAGTVTDETLVQAARDLDAGARYRG